MKSQTERPEYDKRKNNPKMSKKLYAKYLALKKKSMLKFHIKNEYQISEFDKKICLYNFHKWINTE